MNSFASTTKIINCHSKVKTELESVTLINNKTMTKTELFGLASSSPQFLVPLSCVPTSGFCLRTRPE